MVPSRGPGHSAWEVDTFSPPLPPAFPPLPAPFQQNALASFPSPPYPPAPLPPRRYQAWLSSAASTLAKAPGWVQDCTSGLDWHRIPGPSPSWQAGRDGSRPRVSWSTSYFNEEKWWSPDSSSLFSQSLRRMTVIQRSPEELRDMEVDEALRELGEPLLKSKALRDEVLELRWRDWGLIERGPFGFFQSRVESIKRRHIEMPQGSTRHP